MSEREHNFLLARGWAPLPCYRWSDPQPPPGDPASWPEGAAVRVQRERDSALLDALLPVALAAIDEEHTGAAYKNASRDVAIGDVMRTAAARLDAVRALSPATRETLARLAKEKVTGETGEGKERT